MCPICNTTDGGRHHYDCPYDDENEKRIIDWKARKEDLIKYPNCTNWRRKDGLFIVVKPN